MREKTTKVANLPGREKKPLLPPSIPARKTSIAKPDIMSKRPKWCFWRMDWDFSISELKVKTCKSGSNFSTGAPKVECCLHVLSGKLKDYEKMTWGEIIKQDNTGSHFISITELKSRNAALYSKFKKLMVEDGVDEPFSLRINSTERIWGIILSDGTFEAVCYDPFHLGWPTDKH